MWTKDTVWDVGTLLKANNKDTMAICGISAAGTVKQGVKYV